MLPAFTLPPNRNSCNPRLLQRTSFSPLHLCNHRQLSTTNVRPQTVASLRDVAHHGGGANMDSKDGAVSIPGQATTKPYPSPQVPEERLRHSNTFCHAAQECGKSMFVRSATNASAVDTERCRQTKISVHQRRAERTRARENVLMQMYNRSHHADLGSGLRTLRSLFHQCSIVSPNSCTACTMCFVGRVAWALIGTAR